MSLRIPSGSASLPQRNQRIPMGRGSSSALQKSDPVARLKSKLQTDKPAIPSRLEALHQKLRASQDIAKSAAHEGVVKRPMNQHVVERPTEKNLSVLPDKHRDDVIGPGTSVARIGQKEASDMTVRGTSVARLGIESIDGKTNSVARLDTKGHIGDLG
ncbi:hypothetical protein IT408_03300 [Candidatus Uhrbacteria bacterium]|nr:hypothetical protein [Candidatus Uhrbacteria bacterium]